MLCVIEITLTFDKITGQFLILAKANIFACADKYCKVPIIIV